MNITKQQYSPAAHRSLLRLVFGSSTRDSSIISALQLPGAHNEKERLKAGKCSALAKVAEDHALTSIYSPRVVKMKKLESSCQRKELIQMTWPTLSSIFLQNHTVHVQRNYMVPFSTH